MLVCDAASVSVDFSQAQVEKKKIKRKIASCIPRRRLEAIHFPHKGRGKRKETILRLRPFLGQHRQHNLFYFFQIKKILPKALGTIITQISPSYTAFTQVSLQVLALAGQSKRQGINGQLKTTLFQYIQLLRRVRYSGWNSFTKHRCSHLS